MFATVGCPLLGKCADDVRPGPAGQPNAPTERSHGTLHAWEVVGGWVGPMMVVSTVSQHAESDFDTPKDRGEVYIAHPRNGPGGRRNAPVERSRGTLPGTLPWNASWNAPMERPKGDLRLLNAQKASYF